MSLKSKISQIRATGIPDQLQGITKNRIRATLRGDVDRRRLEALVYSRCRTKLNLGQFLTPASIAEFMASLFSPLTRSEICLLDPGDGVGSLTAAFVQRACHEQTPPKHVSVTAYEIDPVLATSLRTTLEECARTGKSAGISN